jgi:hypothetical protein
MRTVLSRHQQEEVPAMWKADRALWKGTGDFRMRREGLRRNLALAICDNLIGHKKTVPNVMRYVLPYITSYRIRRDQVRLPDIEAALRFVRDAQKQNPTPFMYSDTDVWTAKRREFFLNPDTKFPVSTRV